MARVSIGKISLTVRYAAEAPAEAKKKQIDQQIVSVSADSIFSWKSQAVPSSTSPEMMYVEEIMILRPTVSKSGPRIHGPSRFPIANGMMYSGAFSLDAWKNVVITATIPNSVAL